MAGRWEFAIDVGGTFTDVVARSPAGEVRTLKILSSGAFKGVVSAGFRDGFRDPARAADPERFWIGAECRLIGSGGAVAERRFVRSCSAGRLYLDAPLPVPVEAGTRYELAFPGAQAPAIAIRYLLGLGAANAFPRLTLKLGTTRGTNALLTRAGARTAFVATAGFGDLLRIGNQDRPRLFDLAIRKPEPLFERSVEVKGRLAACGTVLEEPDPEEIREKLTSLRRAGVESVAICLMHSPANPAHERLVADLAHEAGFTEISASAEVAPHEKIVSRGDTTVLDAYLNPILRRYVAGIATTLGPRTDFKAMTSAGGLIDAGGFRGRDCILSGPAGGVVGYAAAARAAGLGRAIGFDMGGTSTDVSRWDGRWELEFEAEKAGVRVVAPMMAIETVAAGGGSVCWFDGVKLAVGPRSAGADPGPACYGKGGPLTVTDLNLVLGRLPARRFPFPLDPEAPVRQLEALCDAIASSPTGRRYHPTELAEGFLAIANANMVRAIRHVSVAKGYDPAEYALVCFGGAAGQHACAVARDLRISRILAHPLAGILSAYGIGMAEVRRFKTRSVLRPYAAEAVAALEPEFVELAAVATAEVAAEGVSPRRIGKPLRSLDLRYRGVDAAITVVEPEQGTWAEAYERQHERLFGYRHAGRELEIVALRVEVASSGQVRSEPTRPVTFRRPEPDAWGEAVFDRTVHRTGIYNRESLRPGDEIAGPAIVCEPVATLVVEAGWVATVTERDDIVLSDATPPSSASRPEVMAAKTGVEADPVRLEIFNNYFAAIAEQMGTVLRRTAGSTNVKERLDFSCALFARDGSLVVNAPHIPVHLGAMGETVRGIIRDNPDMMAGDVFVTNDPYRGGSHLPDITVVTPVFLDNNPATGSGAEAGPRFFVASRAHHADIGGSVPGSMPPFSRSLAEEGVVIRNFKLVAAGEPREQELAALLQAGGARDVAANLADLRAQVAANRTGAEGLADLVGRSTLAIVEAYMAHIQAAAAAKMRQALSKLPAGTRHFTDHLDDGTAIAVTIDVQHGPPAIDVQHGPPAINVQHGPPAIDVQLATPTVSATIDFAGTGPVVPGNLNANRAIVTAAVLYCFRCLLAEEIPLNQGVLDPLAIRIPPGCLLDPPDSPDPALAPAVVGGNVETSQRIVDAILGALGVAAASQGTMNNLAFGDASFGYYETLSGGAGATPSAAGADAVHTHMTNTRLTDPEVLERRYPVRLRRFAIRRGSGGLGLYRGGDGAVRELEFLRPLGVSILSERRGPYPPYGLAGGEPGALGRNVLWRKGAQEPLLLGAKVQFDVEPGDRLIIETPGGGGYGSPKPAG